jgi:exosome complex component RRP46
MLIDRLPGGSFETGSKQMLASFHGPQEVRIRDELVDRATLEVVHRPLDGIAGEATVGLQGATC